MTGKANTNWTKVALKVFLTTAVILGTFPVIRKYVPVPYAVMAFEAAVVLLVITKKGSSEKTRALAFNLAFGLIAFGLVEIYLAGLGNILFGKGACIKIRQGEGSFGMDFYDSDELRGYTPKPEQHARSKVMTVNHDVIYDVIYSTDQHGLRVTPHNDNPVAKPILFFGCSVTFGEGLNDDETLPYMFQRESDNEYKAWNFAAPGYGPHQMLRIIESGLIDSVVGEKPAVAVYSALMPHIERSAGNYPYFLWDVNGPRYVLNDRGEAEFKGKFVNSRAWNFTLRLLSKSYLIDRIMPFILGHKRNNTDIDLFISILTKSRDLLQDRYGTKFYVILWYAEDKDLALVISKLIDRKINFITTKGIFSGSKYDPARYYLHECDRHPSALANREISTYLFNYLSSAKK